MQILCNDRRLDGDLASDSDQSDRWRAGPGRLTRPCCDIDRAVAHVEGDSAGAVVRESAHPVDSVTRPGNDEAAADAADPVGIGHDRIRAPTNTLFITFISSFLCWSRERTRAVPVTSLRMVPGARLATDEIGIPGDLRRRGIELPAQSGIVENQAICIEIVALEAVIARDHRRSGAVISTTGTPFGALLTAGRNAIGAVGSRESPCRLGPDSG